jgi:hypothetical protein
MGHGFAQADAASYSLDAHGWRLSALARATHCGEPMMEWLRTSGLPIAGVVLIASAIMLYFGVDKMQAGAVQKDESARYWDEKAADPLYPRSQEEFYRGCAEGERAAAASLRRNAQRYTLGWQFALPLGLVCMFAPSFWGRKSSTTVSQTPAHSAPAMTTP